MNISELISKLAFEFQTEGSERTRECYESTLKSVLNFTRGNVPEISDVFSKNFLHRYQEHMLTRGLRRNTISFYMSILRSTYNYAVENQLVVFTYGLFEHVFTGSEPTVKRAASMSTINKLLKADLSASPILNHCRNLFVLSFYLQGMSFIDMAYLRKSDWQGNMISYRRHKTGGLVNVSVLDEAAELLDRYSIESGASPYLLPIVTLDGSEGRKQYKNALRNHNRRLKSLSQELGLEENLSSYVARHSWATIAHHSGVDVSVVSMGMGHHTEEMTRIYLSSFEQSELTLANRVVLEAVLACNEEVVTKQERTAEKHHVTTPKNKKNWTKNKKNGRSSLGKLKCPSSRE